MAATAWGCTVAAAALLAGVPANGQAGQAANWLERYSQVERAELHAKLAALSQALQVSEKTLLVVLAEQAKRELQFDQLVEAFEGKAREVVRLRDELTALRQKVAQLSDLALRDSATQILYRARTAFEDGRLADAEAALGELEILRRAGTDEAIAAWIDAVIARAGLAELRLDYDRSTDLRLEAAQQAKRLRATLEEAEWNLAMGAGHAQLMKGQTFADAAALERAADILRTRALSLASATQPERWAATHNELGRVLVELGVRRGEEAPIRDGVAAYGEALKQYTPESNIVKWATIRNNVGGSIMRLGERKRDGTTLREAAKILREVVDRLPVDADRDLWADAQTNLATTLWRIAEGDQSAEGFEQADREFERAIRAREGEGLSYAGAILHMNRGAAALGWHQYAAQRPILDKAIAELDLVADFFTFERSRRAWAQVRLNAAGTHAAVATVYGDTSALPRAQAAYEDALRVYTEAGSPGDWAAARLGLVLVQALQAEYQTPEGLAKLRKAAVAARQKLVEKGLLANLKFADQVLAALDQIESKLRAE